MTTPERSPLPKVKRCPFCGGQAKLHCVKPEDEPYIWWYQHDNKKCPIGHIETKGHKSPIAAREAWNRRVV